jgi:mRNA-degrading endonuclease RelE of RelBE toxin-antitoxin system
MKDTIIQVRVEPELREKLQKMADNDSRKLSDFIRLQLTKLVESASKKK